MPPPTSSSGRSALAMIARGALELVRIGARAARLRLQRALVDPEIRGVEIVLAVADVFRHVEHHRPRPSARRDREGAAQQLRNALGRLDADQLLHGGAQDFDLPRLLRHVLPGVVAVGVADDRDLRHAGVERLDQRGDQIGRAGPERRVAHAGAVGDARVGVGREGAAALVVDEDSGAGRARASPRRRAAAGSRPCRTSGRRPRASASRRAPARR